MACCRRRGGGERGLLDGSGDGLGVRIGHFVIVGSVDVGGGFFVFDVGGFFSLTALFGGGEEEAGFYG